MWISGEVQTVQRLEIHAASVAITSSSLAIAQPDGTMLNPSPAVTSAPAGMALQHTLQALVPVTQVGRYQLTWQYATSDGQSFSQPETHFASYVDIAGLIRRRLLESTTTLAEADIDAEVDFTVRTLVDRFVAIQKLGGYAGLSGLDCERFDEAVGLLTAVRMRAYRPKQAPVEEISQVKLGQSAFVYAPPPVGSGKTPRSLAAQWLSEAAAALGRVSAVQAQYAAAASAFQPFRVSGPTRYVKSVGEIETVMGSVIRLLTDDWFLTADYIQGDAGLWVE